MRTPSLSGPSTAVPSARSPRWPRAAWIALLLTIPALWMPPSLARAQDAPVPVVENPAEPTGGRVVLEPEEQWRLGGYSENEGEFFGVVRQGAVDAAGNTYLLDEQLHEIKVFDAAGTFLTVFGRQGEGPGELSRPQDLVLLADGRVGVVHGRPARLTVFPPEGGMGEDITLGEGETFGFTLRMERAGERPVVQRSITTMGDGTQTSTQLLASVDPATGAYHTVYLEQSDTQDRLGTDGRVMITLRADFVRDWGVGPDDRLYVVRDGEGYEIEVFAADGTPERTIRRAYERLPKPDEVLEDERADRREMAERFGMDFDESEIDRYYPDIISLHARANGELWVLPSRGRASDDPEVLGVFDVFDPEGRFVRQVEVRVPYDRTEDEFSFEGDALLVFEDSLDALRASQAGATFVITTGEEEDDEGEVEPLEIVRYRLD